jgi:hypothetical protein
VLPEVELDSEEIIAPGMLPDVEAISEETIAPGMLPDTKCEAGRSKQHLPFWKSITNDSNILQLVHGCKIEFDSEPEQLELQTPYKFPQGKKQKIAKEIELMLSKNIIEKTNLSTAAFVSNIFSRPKKDGCLRVILDLTELNQNVTYRHFKMDTLQTAIDLMTPNCFMASIDWREAYYSVPMAENMKTFLVFQQKRKPIDTLVCLMG